MTGIRLSVLSEDNIRKSLEQLEKRYGGMSTIHFYSLVEKNQVPENISETDLLTWIDLYESLVEIQAEMKRSAIYDMLSQCYQRKVGISLEEKGAAEAAPLLFELAN